MNTQLKKGALEICVLSQLAKGDKYGYELTEVISREMDIAAGTLYPILKRLKDDLYVETYLRKYYHLTSKGKEYQQTLKQEWEDFVLAMERLLNP